MEATVLTRKSEYVVNCVSETETSVYGRDNRKPIHDAIAYCTGMTRTLGAWCMDIGLCVENGKLCAIFQN